MSKIQCFSLVRCIGYPIFVAICFYYRKVNLDRLDEALIVWICCNYSAGFGIESGKSIVKSWYGKQN